MPLNDHGHLIDGGSIAKRWPSCTYFIAIATWSSAGNSRITTGALGRGITRPIIVNNQSRANINIIRLMIGYIKEYPIIIVSKIVWDNQKAKGTRFKTGELIPEWVGILICILIVAESIDAVIGTDRYG